ncbi:MAG: ABC transporter ATP-binding protein [Candidatus Omnitrophica bacterium]|nr:ABC transporter ATP-binding protein [Candidatus Omnitrophota bacterium]
MVEVKKVHKIYTSEGKPLEVLKGIDLKIEKEDFVAIVGPSGAGKSTLLHLIGGLDLPTKGDVYFEGLNLYNISEEERAKIRNKKIGFVFQFYHLLPEFNVLENVYIAGMVYDSFHKRRRYREKAEEILTMLGLEERFNHKPSELSGGEQQRVAIARALINEPLLLLCDEPTGNLDSQMGELVLGYLMEINKEKGQTVVLVTHSQEIAEKAKRIIYIKDGEITGESLKKEIVF